MVYEMDINESQAYYTVENVILRKSGGAQASNYVGTGFFKAAIEKGVIFQTTIEGYPPKRDFDEQYALNENYSFELGSGILDLIGNDYKDRNNKFVVSFPQTKSGKPQLNKVVYKTLAKNDRSYEWFVELYSNNITGNKLVFDIDEENKKLVVDVRFTAITTFLSTGNVPPIDSEEDIDETIDDEIDGFDDVDCPHNRIVFGAPGTGKSFRLNKDKKRFGDRYERVTFHPNYSYSQFVGTYKPVPITYEDKDGNEVKEITYEYIPGPFMRAYVKSVNSDDPYLLLIEEINRANVTSVFGEVFQLLDRENGVSEYPIETTEDMRDYFDEHVTREDFDSDRIAIPKNMYIWASMNSADQGVFPMDTAFKRRWEFEYIGINDNDEKIKNIMVTVGEGDNKHQIEWNALRTAINNKLSNDYKINEDKLLGPYFLSKDIIATETYEWNSEPINVKDNDKFLKAFKSKVLMYLFEDVAKQYGPRLFEGCEDSTKYSSICKDFDKKGEAIFGDDFINKYADKEE